MKHMSATIVAAAALLGGLNPAAHATSLQCRGFTQTLGFAGNNPPLIAVVTHYPGAWTVRYVLQSGMTVDRSTQFTMTDNPDGPSRTSWRGWSRKSDQWMHGEVRQRTGRLIYVEDLYDHSRNLLASNEIDCGQVAAPTYEPPVVASAPDVQYCSSFDGKSCSQSAPAPTVTTIAPTPTSSTIDKVAITFSKGGAYVAVSIGTMPATMLVDTGATGMTVSETIANWLVANGQATNGSTDHATLAGGVQKDFRGIDIGSVSVGGHVVRNIHAGVVPDGADMLLGLGVLAEVSPKFAINVATSTLDFQ